MFSNPMMGGGARGRAVELTDTVIDTGNHAANVPYTFTDAAIGAAGGDRLIIAAFSFSWNGDANVPLGSCTIDGVSATIAASAPSYAQGTAIAYVVRTNAQNPSTTATVVATFAGAKRHVGLDVYVIKGYGSATPINAYTSYIMGQGQLSPSMDITTTVPAGAVCIYAAGIYSGTLTWSSITPDRSGTLEAPASFSVGRQEPETTLSDHVETVSAGVNQHMSIAAVVWD